MPAISPTQFILGKDETCAVIRNKSNTKFKTLEENIVMQEGIMGSEQTPRVGIIHRKNRV